MLVGPAADAHGFEPVVAGDVRFCTLVHERIVAPVGLPGGTWLENNSTCIALILTYQDSTFRFEFALKPVRVWLECRPRPHGE
jgi:hypothetical protein